MGYALVWGKHRCCLVLFRARLHSGAAVNWAPSLQTTAATPDARRSRRIISAQSSIMFVSHGHTKSVVAMLAMLPTGSLANELPNSFPAAATYTAHLRTTNQSKLCPLCTFDGEHHYNSDRSREFGHVAWYYGPTSRAKPFTNFLDVFLGAQQQMFLVHEGSARSMHASRAVPCSDLQPFVGAGGGLQRRQVVPQAPLPHVYRGVPVLHPRGDPRERLLRGLFHGVEEFWYEAATFSTATPGDEFFTNVNTLNCSKHAHAEAPSRARLGA